MIQRFIYAALKQGIEEIKADPAILQHLFGDHFSLTETEVQAIQKVFDEKTPHVVHGFLPLDAKLPAYSITLQNEEEAETVLGDEAGIIDDPDDPDYGADVYASIWSHNYNVLCYAEHPDVTSYLYEAAKAIFLSAKPIFIDEALFEIHLSGMDLAPDPRYIPEHLFVRQLGFRCQREFQQVDYLSKLRKAFRVRGLHVDRSGSPSDVGGVKTLVTVSGADDGQEA